MGIALITNHPIVICDSVLHIHFPLLGLLLFSLLSPAANTRVQLQEIEIYTKMPPLGMLSEADIRRLNDPTRSVKRAQIVSLCRKASLKAKGTVRPLLPQPGAYKQNAELIAALTAAAAQTNIDNNEDRENIDPLKHRSTAKEFDGLDKQSESSFETVVHINPKPWSESTPAPRTRKKAARGLKSTKRKSSLSAGLYPQLGVYPDLSENAVPVPTISTEQFGKIAEGILEEMNTRAAGASKLAVKANKSKTSETACIVSTIRSHIPRHGHTPE